MSISITKSLDLFEFYCTACQSWKKIAHYVVGTEQWTSNIHTEHGVRLYSYVNPKDHFGSHLFWFFF